MLNPISSLSDALNQYAILLDVDGTILDLAPTPREVFVSHSLRDTLARLWKRTEGGIAFVSGRPVSELDLIFSPLQLPTIGGHGAEDVVRAAAANICSAASDGSIELLPGKLVLEVKQTGVTKATAVRELMTYSPFAQRRPIFIGDDVTDLGVFDILPDFDGIGIIVGRRDVPTANAYFERPADVRRWLEQISRDDAFAKS